MPVLDVYLRIAEEVLKAARKPLGPRDILKHGYRLDIVPHNLHGKTQHKTLQARLSEDILHSREKSKFFRPNPGKFFLRQFLSDTSLPEEYRQPIVARRRVRELEKEPSLAIHKDVLMRFAKINSVAPQESFRDIVKSGDFYYEDPKNPSKDSVFVWAFVLLSKGTSVFSYRVGRYRDGDLGFYQKRTIGIKSLVYECNRDLFNLVDCGVRFAGVKATLMDLDIPEVMQPNGAMVDQGTLHNFMWSNVGKRGHSDFVGVISLSCPEWFEPTKRRLAMNDVRWLDFKVEPNNLQDFDDWSAQILQSKNLVLRK